MATQTDDAFELNDLELLCGNRMIGCMDTVNTGILYDVDLMKKNEQDVLCTSPVGNEVDGTVPQTQTFITDDEFNADIAGYNTLGNYREQTEISYESQEPNFHNLVGHNYPFPPQEEYVIPQQCNNNHGYYVGAHPPVYTEEECYYEAPQQAQYPCDVDVSAYGVPVDLYNYQPSAQQYKEPIHSPVHPTQQLDISSLKITTTSAPARYKKGGTPSRRQYIPRNPRGQELGYDEELMVPDIAEEQSGCGRRGRGKAGTRQNSVQRHRQSIKDFLESAPKNIENLKMMDFAVVQANDELNQMLCTLQGMLGYGRVPELNY